jgi:hypothetical protein
LDDFLGEIEAEPLDLRSSAEPGNENYPLHPKKANPLLNFSYASPTAEIKISIILIAINGATAPPNP